MTSSTGSLSVILSPDNFFFNRDMKNRDQNSSSDNCPQHELSDGEITLGTFSSYTRLMRGCCSKTSRIRSADRFTFVVPS